MTLQPIPLEPSATLGDHRRCPGCRLLLTCALCGWSKDYRVEAIIERLRKLRAGGHATAVGAVARHVGWTCPGCGRVKWRSDLAWPAGLDAREAKRLMNLYRN